MKRRDFIKCGFGGAGLAVGSGLASSADNSPSSPGKSVYGHPRWVKMIPRPKLAVDDNVYSRFKESNNVFGSFTRYYGTQNREKLMQESRDKTIKYYLEKRPGYRLEDRALADAAWVISRLGGLNRGTRA